MDLTWYNTLNKPFLTPPPDLFAPAWTILYTLIFLALVLFLTAKTDFDKTLGLTLFLTQLILNLLWSPAFFYWHNLQLSLLIIILLIISIIATIISFYKISNIASYLLIPYLLWVCFAAYLNFGFMIMN